MSKSFKTSPKPALQPTAEQIAAFERGGMGTDTHKPTTVGNPEYGSGDYPAPVEKAFAERLMPKVVPAPEPAAEPIKRLSIDLPASMHTRFKTACSATSTKMAAEIMAFIEQRTRELEARAGLIR